MLCQCCGKKSATTYIRAVSGGKLVRLALCPDCARKLGLEIFFPEFGFPPEDGAAGGFFEGEGLPGEIHCPLCGATFADIARSGMVGCAQCYRTFSARLAPVIRRIHGGSVHRGKVPGVLPSRVAKAGHLAVRVRRKEKPGGGDTE